MSEAKDIFDELPFLKTALHRWEKHCQRLRVCRKALREIREAPAYLKMKRADLLYWTREEELVNSLVAKQEREIVRVLHRQAFTKHGRGPKMPLARGDR